MGKTISPDSIEREKKRLTKEIHQKILSFYKMNPKSKIEQLLNFTQNFQSILANRMDFPQIKNGPFHRNESFFETKSSNEMSKE